MNHILYTSISSFSPSLPLSTQSSSSSAAASEGYVSRNRKMGRPLSPSLRLMISQSVVQCPLIASVYTTSTPDLCDVCCCLCLQPGYGVGTILCSQDLWCRTHCRCLCVCVCVCVCVCDISSGPPSPLHRSYGRVHNLPRLGDAIPRAHLPPPVTGRPHCPLDRHQIRRGPTTLLSHGQRNQTSGTFSEQQW